MSFLGFCKILLGIAAGAGCSYLIYDGFKENKELIRKRKKKKEDNYYQSPYQQQPTEWSSELPQPQQEEDDKEENTFDENFDSVMEGVRKTTTVCGKVLSVIRTITTCFRAIYLLFNDNNRGYNYNSGYNYDNSYDGYGGYSGPAPYEMTTGYNPYYQDNNSYYYRGY